MLKVASMFEKESHCKEGGELLRRYNQWSDNAIIPRLKRHHCPFAKQRLWKKKNRHKGGSLKERVEKGDNELKEIKLLKKR